MTTIRFYRSQDRFSGFSCQGHSGYADAGEDIVCAAITSAIRLAECTINDVLNAQAQVQVKEKTAEISLQLPAGNPGGDAVIEGLFLYLTELSKENPHHLSVLEV
jgi:uncharacterized protein YsxB (DUF464 family)